MSSQKNLVKIINGLPFKEWNLDSADRGNHYWNNGNHYGSSEGGREISGSWGYQNYSAKSGDYTFHLSYEYETSTYTSGPKESSLSLDIMKRKTKVKTPSEIDVEILFKNVIKNTRRRN